MTVVTTNGAIGEILSTSLFTTESEQLEASLVNYSSSFSFVLYIGKPQRM